MATERTLSLGPSPSIGRLATARPNTRPSPARSSQAAASSRQERARARASRDPSQKATNTRRAAPMPSPALSRQSGWFDIGSPNWNFGSRALIVVEPPIAAHGPFQQALPRLVERLDQVDLPPLLPWLPQRRRSRRAPDWPARGEPLRASGRHLASPPRRSRSPCRGSRLHFVADLPHMGDGILRAHRIVLPIGKDVDGDEVGRRGELGRLEPKFPDIGIGDRQARAPHLLQIASRPSAGAARPSAASRCRR